MTSKPWTHDPKVRSARKMYDDVVADRCQKREVGAPYAVNQAHPDELFAIICEAVAAACLAAHPDSCKWTSSEGEMESYYETSCGNALTFIEGGVKENEITFCNYCGKRVEEIRITDDAASTPPTEEK